jgi:flagellar basal body rod protein FlgC
MIDPIRSGMQGLEIASARVANAARNVSNAGSVVATEDESGNITTTPYEPTDIVVVSDENRGTFAIERPSSSSDADNAIASVDYVTKNLVELIDARAQFNASLTVIERANDLLDRLLD